MRVMLGSQIVPRRINVPTAATTPLILTSFLCPNLSDNQPPGKAEIKVNIPTTIIKLLVLTTAFSIVRLKVYIKKYGAKLRIEVIAARKNKRFTTHQVKADWRTTALLRVTYTPDHTPTTTATIIAVNPPNPTPRALARPAPAMGQAIKPAIPPTMPPATRPANPPVKKPASMPRTRNMDGTIFSGILGSISG